MVKRLLIFVLLLVLAGILAGQGKYITVEVDTVTVEVDTVKAYPTSMSQAKARTDMLAWMRELALEKALPQDIHLTSMTTDMYVERNNDFDEATAKSVFMISSSAGLIVREEVLDEDTVYPKKSQVYRLRMKYRATVLPLERTYNSDLDLNVELSETSLRHNEEFDLSVTANRDGFLYIFDFLPDNSVALSFPTLTYENNRIKAKEPWQQKMTAVIEEGEEHSIETLYFVFSTEAIEGWYKFSSNRDAENLVFSAGQESFTLFQNWLFKSDPAKRVEKMVQLHIFR
jgi:hypothetical protein